jgi:heme-degrading monooxygenase HmoA
MFARMVVVKCQQGKEASFGERARVGLRFYREQPGCRGVQLLSCRADRTQLVVLSFWDRETDLAQARDKPEYRQAMVGLTETYSEPQSVGEWDVVEI